MAAPFKQGIVMPREIFTHPVSYTVAGFVYECTCGCPDCEMQNAHGAIMLTMDLGPQHQCGWWLSQN